MTADDVAAYLKDNPNFFEDYHELLAQLHVPHPHGGRAISITERQILTLREKSRQLESKLASLIRFGEENDAISDKVHRLSLALALAGDSGAALRALRACLGEDFKVPQVALRLWGTDQKGETTEFTPASESLRQYAADLKQAYVGASDGMEAVAWFGEAAAQVRSVALVALRKPSGEAVGLLAMASPDPDRFFTDMGTLYVERIGELVGANLLRVLA